MLKLAVIGGGPSAVCVVEAVAGHVAPIAQVDMTVFEPGPNLWRGQVFQRDGDEVLANVPMVEMSARAWDREHGVRWLREHGLGMLAAETVFPSRSLVGRYFQDAAGAPLAVMRARGSRARVEAQAVRALVRDEGQLWAHGEGWRAGRSSSVTQQSRPLALGSGEGRCSGCGHCGVMKSLDRGWWSSARSLALVRPASPDPGIRGE
jgi:hypothetical protein